VAVCQLVSMSTYNEHLSRFEVMEEVAGQLPL